jgi:hypothetical protein
MRHVKDSEIVADLNSNDYFLLCQKEHLANTKSDDCQLPELTSSVSIDIPGVVDARPDLLVGGGGVGGQLLRHNTSWKSFDIPVSNPSSPLSQSQNYGRGVNQNGRNSLLDRSYSPSSFAANSAEVSIRSLMLAGWPTVNCLKYVFEQEQKPPWNHGHCWHISIVGQKGPQPVPVKTLGPLGALQMCIERGRQSAVKCQ